MKLEQFKQKILPTLSDLLQPEKHSFFTRFFNISKYNKQLDPAQKKQAENDIAKFLKSANELDFDLRQTAFFYSNLRYLAHTYGIKGLDDDYFSKLQTTLNTFFIDKDICAIPELITFYENRAKNKDFDENKISASGETVAMLRLVKNVTDHYQLEQTKIQKQVRLQNEIAMQKQQEEQKQREEAQRTARKQLEPTYLQVAELAKMETEITENRLKPIADFHKQCRAINEKIAELKPQVTKEIRTEIKRSPEEIAWDKECAESHNCYEEPAHYKTIIETVPNEAVIKQIAEKQAELDVLKKDFSIKKQIPSLLALCQTAILTSKFVMFKAPSQQQNLRLTVDIEGTIKHFEAQSTTKVSGFLSHPCAKELEKIETTVTRLVG